MPHVSDAPHPIDLVVPPRDGDVGAFTVRRTLPWRRHRSVGPFVFLDEMGPVRLAPGQGLDVAPHPHIGLATVTWMLAGEILHRDSLGSIQAIRPGELNWMTAGAGIVHSERSPDAARARGGTLHGLQCWVALPRAHEETAAAFAHYGAADLPVIEGDGCRVTLIAGAAWGRRAPVATLGETLFAEARLAPGAALTLPADIAELALYPLEGTVTIAGRDFAREGLLVLRGGATVAVKSTGGAHVMVLGGAALDAPRHIWWNFVASSRGRIEAAKAAWRERRFAAVPGDPEQIPLPLR